MRILSNNPAEILGLMKQRDLAMGKTYENAKKLYQDINTGAYWCILPRKKKWGWLFYKRKLPFKMSVYNGKYIVDEKGVTFIDKFGQVKFKPHYQRRRWRKIYKKGYIPW